MSPAQLQSRGRRWPGAVTALALVAALSLVTSCSGEATQTPAPCRCECPPAKGGLSSALLSRLATARALHHQADILLGQGKLDGAMERVRGILALDLDSRWPEAEEVRLDATARLAKLLGDKKGDLEAALKLVDEELKGKLRPSFYAANLHSTRGDLLEAKVKKLDAAGKKKEAKATARLALAAFEASIRINKALQAKLPGKTKGGAPAPTSAPSGGSR